MSTNAASMTQSRQPSVSLPKDQLTKAKVQEAVDHLVGVRTSTKWRKRKVFGVLMISFLVMRWYRLSHQKSPKWLIFLNSLSRRFAPWQVAVATLTVHYIFRNLFLLLSLEGPDASTLQYSPNYYRATWLMKCMDAGFWTAMNLRPKFLSNIMSIVFFCYFLLAPDHAEHVCKRYRNHITIDIIRNSWEKMAHPLFLFIVSFHSCTVRTKLELKVPRTLDGRVLCDGSLPMPIVPSPQRRSMPTPESDSSENAPPLASSTYVDAVLFFSDSIAELRRARRLVLHVPGGGFVCQTPHHHASYMQLLAKRLRVPILSINYKKSPEYTYPFALLEIFDVYRVLVQSRGAAIGINVSEPVAEQLQIVVMGDSAGANLLAAMICKVLNETNLPAPNACVFVYALLNFDMQGWMHREHRELLKKVLDSGTAVLPNGRDPITESSDAPFKNNSSPEERNSHPRRSSRGPIDFTLTSRMRYLNDVIISPELLVEMAHLYLGEAIYVAARPATDMYLSPIVAPDSILERFPPVYVQCGDRDPFIDDSLLLAARLSQLNTQSSTVRDPASVNARVELTVFEGMSHAYLQMLGMLPEAPHAIELLGDYLARALFGPALRNMAEEARGWKAPFLSAGLQTTELPSLTPNSNSQHNPFHPLHATTSLDDDDVLIVHGTPSFSTANNAPSTTVATLLPNLSTGLHLNSLSFANSRQRVRTPDAKIAEARAIAQARVPWSLFGSTPYLVPRVQSELDLGIMRRQQQLLQQQQQQYNK